MKLEMGKVAVVTGASSGIGRALCRGLAQRGLDIALVDINEDGAQETRKEVEAIGRRAAVFRVDVADRAAMMALPDRVSDHFDRIDVLCNNAGVAVQATIEEHDLDDFEWLMGINLFGVLYGCKAFLPLLRRQPEAHIVNLSSMFGFIGLPTQGAYCASKAAVRSLSETLYSELRGTGIGVTSVHPGGIDTDIVKSARMADEEGRASSVEAFARFGSSPESAAKKIVRAIERNQLRLRIRPESFVTDWAKRLSPVWTQALAARAFAWGQAREARNRSAQ